MLFYLICGCIILFIVLSIIKKDPPNIVLISGLSGSGKTRVGKKIARNHDGFFIDIDDYFLPKSQLPKTQLPTTGRIVTNYDCYEAIDWKRFERDLNRIKKSKKCNLIIIVGFCLPFTEKHYQIVDIQPIEYDFHFHLLLDKEVCKQRRIQSKNLSGERIAVDSLEVDDLVWPFYCHHYDNGPHYHKAKYQKLPVETIDATLDPEDVYDHISGILFSLGYIDQV